MKCNFSILITLFFNKYALDGELYALLEALSHNSSVISLQLNVERASEHFEWARIKEVLLRTSTLQLVRFVGLHEDFAQYLQNKGLVGMERLQVEFHLSMTSSQEARTRIQQQQMRKESPERKKKREKNNSKIRKQETAPKKKKTKKHRKKDAP